VGIVFAVGKIVCRGEQVKGGRSRFLLKLYHFSDGIGRFLQKDKCGTEIY
jgi:hypothetical protein